jgi:AcrR family transcriptional regulator
MGITFEQSTDRYLSALQAGASVGDAITEATLSQHREVVFDAAVEMLEADGVIDMKHLAARAGISRASLYRYYPDKLAVEAEVAAALVRRMTAAAEPFDRVVDKADAAIGVLLDFPAGAAALGPVVAAADIEVIATSSEVVVGHRGVAPVLVGFAAMIAAASRRSQLDDVRAMRHAVIEQFRLSIA